MAEFSICGIHARAVWCACAALFIAFFAASTVVIAGDADGSRIEIVTGRGNVFVAEQDASRDGTDADAARNGTSMLDGFGLTNRLVYKEYGGTVIHGAQRQGVQDSMRPYNTVDPNVGFAASVTSEDGITQMPIPEFYRSYSYHNGSLATGHQAGPDTGILGYTEQRTLWGDITASVASTHGIRTDGSGRLILKIGGYNDTQIVIRGNLSDGTTVRLVDSPYDLVRLPYGTAGFLVNHCRCDPAPGGVLALVGSVDDSVKSAVFEYDQSASASVYHGKCCKGRYTTSGTFHQTVVPQLVINAHPSGYHAVAGDTTDPVLMDIDDIKRPGAKTLRVYYNRAENFEHRVYDTLPAKLLTAFPKGAFESTVTLAEGTRYLVVDSPGGGTSVIRGTAVADRLFLDVGGLPAHTAYRVVHQDGAGALRVGSTSHDGRILVDIPQDSTFSGVGGRLVLYDDSLTYTRSNGNGGTGMLVFDHANSQVFRLPLQQHLPGDRLYNVHAYAKIPVSGTDVRIFGVNLDDDTVRLGYLNGTYSAGDAVLVPIIPTYGVIGMSIDGTAVSLRVEDVTGGSGVHITDAVSSTVSTYSPNGFTGSVSATAGSVAFMISATDGDAKAHVRATVSGESEITNTRKFVHAYMPPPPPPPAPRDPLTTWVEVYVNGDLRAVDGQNRTQIFFSDRPVEDHTGWSKGFASHHTARFSYPAVTVSDTLSVPVRAADFVEFYFYNRIEAEGSIPPVPPGFQEYGRNSAASATAVLRYASISTSM